MLPSTRHRLLILLPLLACSALAAQTPAPATPAPARAQVQESKPLDPRQNQKVQKIHVEDEGVAIDEVRYAGQTQSITVHPKADVPAYEIQPENLARSRPSERREGLGSGPGQRVWNVLNF